MNQRTCKLIRKAIAKTFSKKNKQEQKIRYRKAKKDWNSTAKPIRCLTRKVLINLKNGTLDSQTTIPFNLDK